MGGAAADLLNEAVMAGFGRSRHSGADAGTALFGRELPLFPSFPATKCRRWQPHFRRHSFCRSLISRWRGFLVSQPLGCDIKMIGSFASQFRPLSGSGGLPQS